MSTLIKTAFRVKSSQGTQAGATQGSPQIQAKDSLSSELRHVCAKGLTRNVITIRHTIRYVRRWERNASLVSFGAANAPPSVRSINLSNLRARALAGGAGGIVHSRKYLLYLAPREEREEESVCECGFWRLASSSLSALSCRDRAPPSFPVVASEDASRRRWWHWGQNTTRKGNKRYPLRC